MSKPDFVRLVEIDLNELIVRMIECLRESSRPPDMTAKELVDSLDEHARVILRQQAIAAADYVMSCCLNARDQRLQ